MAVVSPSMAFSVESFLRQRQLNKHGGWQTMDQIWSFVRDQQRLNQFAIEGGSLLFRGQSNGAYGVNSSLYRTTRSAIDTYQASIGSLTPAKKSMGEWVLARTECGVLEEAHANGIGMGLSNLETLALLQHHLSPTRLLDVSASPLVSLFFAVEKNDSIPGRLFIFTVRNETLPAEDTSSDPNALPWSDWVKLRVARNNWATKVWHAPISPLDARMRAQQGSFLVGGLYSSGGGFNIYRTAAEGSTAISATDFRQVCTLTINFPANRLRPPPRGKWTAYAWSVEIEAAWKEPLRKLLAAERITADSVYPPLDEVKRLLDHVAAEKAADATRELAL